MPLEFGIFDHLDDNGIPLADLFETRLKLTELYDRAGFRSYHIAEHHSTPLGMAPSPSVFLAAVAQRTKRLRFGPLLYVTPMYHPLRVAEEVVMLDHMSRGRFELGLGRGASPRHSWLRPIPNRPAGNGRNRSAIFTLSSKWPPTS
jgi:alkanesulfonate monooxygenase SsuD/methylene tetrahydromethanopterin reductase-like flavin-dependent oxidoreductase (luciferase family)